MQQEVTVAGMSEKHTGKLAGQLELMVSMKAMVTMNDGSNQNQVQARRLSSMSEVALQANRHDDVNKNKLWYYLLWAAKPQLWHDNDLSRKVITQVTPNITQQFLNNYMTHPNKASKADKWHSPLPLL